MLVERGEEYPAKTEMDLEGLQQLARAGQVPLAGLRAKIGLAVELPLMERSTKAAMIQRHQAAIIHRYLEAEITVGVEVVGVGFTEVGAAALLHLATQVEAVVDRDMLEDQVSLPSSIKLEAGKPKPTVQILIIKGLDKEIPLQGERMVSLLFITEIASSQM
jgi:hypothetical protein